MKAAAAASVESIFIMTSDRASEVFPRVWAGEPASRPTLILPAESNSALLQSTRRCERDKVGASVKNSQIRYRRPIFIPSCSRCQDGLSSAEWAHDQGEPRAP